MMKIFHPSQNEIPPENEQNPLGSDIRTQRNHPAVQKWDWEILKNVSNTTKGAFENIPGIVGTPVRLAQDEKQRLVAEAKHKADEMISGAQKQAQELLFAAQKEVDEIHQAAYESGRNQAITELQKTTDEAKTIISEMETWRKETIQHSETVILEMVQKISRILFGKGMSLNQETLQNNFNKIITMADSLGNIRVYVNQQDANILDSEWRKFQEAMSSNRILVIPSETILPGGCYIQGDMGVVDARIETQLNAIMEALNQDIEGQKEHLS
jgi:flagellar biosynthesis/type III secretory pathway protein FliH